MTNLTRVDTTRMDFGWDPGQRVAKVTAALNAQRANLRAAPAGSIDAGTAARNVDDLQVALSRAEANAAARQRQTQALEAARAASQQEHDARALAATTDQLRRDYLSQPGTSETEFEKVLPELLAEHRKQAVLNAPVVFAQQVAEARRRLGGF